MNKSLTRRALVLGATTALVSGLTVQNGFAAFVEPALPSSAYIGPLYRGKGMIALELMLDGQIDPRSVVEIEIPASNYLDFVYDSPWYPQEKSDLFFHLWHEKVITCAPAGIQRVFLHPSVWEVVEA